MAHFQTTPHHMGDLDRTNHASFLLSLPTDPIETLGAAALMATPIWGMWGWISTSCFGMKTKGIPGRF